MAESIGPIASAVILPEAPIPKPSPPPTKRRQSSASEEGSASKRPRLSHDDNVKSPPLESPSDAQQFKDSNRDRRRTSVVEEKKRGQRLFGGLLSTLSQSTSSGQQKRRQDIEKRQLERAKAQKAQDEVKRKEKLANLKVVRRAEQIKWDEQSMKVRHQSIRAQAQFLCTKAEPKLYYKPWELLPEESDRIKQQAADAEVLIEKEIAEFRERHPQTTEPDPEEVQANNTSKETVGEPHTESPSVVANNDDTTNLVQEDSNPEPRKDEVKEKQIPEEPAQEEHNGEVVMENEEDTVIY